MPFLPRNVTRQHLILMLIVLTTEVLIGFAVLFLLRNQQDHILRTLSQVESERDTILANIAQLDRLKQEQILLRSRLQRLEPRIPLNKIEFYTPTLIAQLYDLAGDTQVRIVSVQPQPIPKPTPPSAPPSPQASQTQPPPSGPAPITTQMNLTIEGTFQQIIDFIQGLNSLPKLVKIKQAQIGPSGQPGAQRTSGPTRLVVTLSLECVILTAQSQTVEVTDERQAGRST